MLGSSSRPWFCNAKKKASGSRLYRASHGAIDEEREGGGGGGSEAELVGAGAGTGGAGGARGAAPAGGRRLDEPPDLLLRLPRLLPPHHPPDPALQVGNEWLARSLPSTPPSSSNQPDALLFSTNRLVLIDFGGSDHRCVLTFWD